MNQDNMYQPDNAIQKATAAILILFAVMMVTAGAKEYEEKQKPSMASGSTISTVQTPTASTSQPINATNSTSSLTFKNGTYTASADYFVPHSSETIRLSLTIKDGVVTNTSVQNSESNPESAAFQQDFSSQYKSFVVGKNIKGLKLFGVAGASDTSQGFNDALNQIQNQAAAQS